MHHRSANRFIAGIVIAALNVSAACGSVDTIGAKGINSAGLGLTGSGIGIGQVENTRPGIPPGHPSADSTANSNSTVVPAGVFVKDGNATPNMNIDDHAEQIAGVLISSDPNAKGVAPGASLYSSAFVSGALSSSTGYNDAILATQQVATQPNVRAVNHSWGKLFPLGDNDFDGNDQLTLAMDWSASKHDVIHVFSGFQIDSRPVPKANFNGLNVAGSDLDPNGVYRVVSVLNDTSLQPPDGRTTIGLIAPGIDVRSTKLNNALSPPVPNMTLEDDGSSLAAPHVTGTVALLQQFANLQIADPNSGWDGEAQHHEVMKSVLMNSADKLKDDGTFIEEGKLLGMERTVLDKNGNNWLASEAFTFVSEDPDTIPLDDQMGAGHLNAKRALQQFLPGEYDLMPDGIDQVATVSKIGWDFGHTTGTFGLNRYIIDQELEEGDAIAITLAWDRLVEKSGDPMLFKSGTHSTRIPILTRTM